MKVLRAFIAILSGMLMRQEWKTKKKMLHDSITSQCILLDSEKCYQVSDDESNKNIK